MKKVSIGLAVLGLALATVLVGWFGVDHVLGALFSVGWRGLGILLAWQIVLAVLLGLAWDLLLPARSRNLAVFTWGRMVREAAGTCLPFSHMGGFVLGARAVTLHGVRWETATAATIADVTSEFVAGFIFSALGVMLLLSQHPGSPFTMPLLVSLGVGLAAGVALIVLQRGRTSIFALLGRRIGGRLFGGGQERVAALEGELARIYGNRAGLIGGTAVHLLAWFATGAGTWLALRLLGSPATLADAIAIEALLRMLLNMAFVVPGYAGVQEAAYVGLGAVFGIPPEIALGISLLRRARDIIFGVPVLLAWQAIEVRRLRARPVTESR